MGKNQTYPFGSESPLKSTCVLLDAIVSILSLLFSMDCRIVLTVWLVDFWSDFRLCLKLNLSTTKNDCSFCGFLASRNIVPSEIMSPDLRLIVFIFLLFTQVSYGGCYQMKRKYSIHLSDSSNCLLGRSFPREFIYIFKQFDALILNYLYDAVNTIVDGFVAQDFRLAIVQINSLLRFSIF